MAKKKSRGITTPVKTLDPMQRYNLTEAANFLRISRSQLYHNICAGMLSTIKEGKRNFVPGSEIARLSALPAARA